VSRIRVTAVLTHPVQYYAPWFRWIEANRRELDLHVVYASRPTAHQQGTGFNASFTWDVPLTDGYRSTVVRDARPSDQFGSGSFRGLDVPEVVDAVRESKPDALVVFGWYSITLVRTIRDARRMRIPVIYYGDTNMSSAPASFIPGVRALWIRKTRWLLSQFDAYLSVGTRSRAYLTHFGVGDGRIFLAPAAVENERFGAAAELRRNAAERAVLRSARGIPPDAFAVLLAGKLEAIKRPLDAIRAVAALGGAHLVVAGSGPLEADCRALAARLGLSASFLGFVNQRDMPSVYAAADCLLVASARESWGFVVNEALASGLPAVMSNTVGCAPELGGAETGAFVTTADLEAYAPALADVRRRIAEGHDFADACVARAASHSFGAATDGLLRACRFVTTPAGPPQVGGHLRTVRGVRLQPDPADPRILACCGSMVLIGGLERMTFEILRVLRSRGAAVHCIVNWWDNTRIVELADAIGASWTMGYYLHQFTRRLRPFDAVRFAWDTLRTSAGLLRDARGFRATHVFVSDYITVLRNAPALMALRATGRTIVLRLGNAPEPGRFFRLLWRLIINPSVDFIVCNSAFTERMLAAHGIPAQKRTTIPHTVPTRTAISGNGKPSQRDEHRVIYVGQIIPDKGVDLLLDAMGLLVARGRDVRLDVVGDMNGWVAPAYEGYREQLLRRSSADDLSGRVRFLGFREDVPGLMAEAGIHCCPSRQTQREAFGIVVIEAKQAGIPSVVLPSGALGELVAHGEDGWVCSSETPESLAEGIDYFLDPGRLSAGMRAARRSAARFSRDRFESAWAGVFNGAGR
jgi:glycosyltransferase involved in cell wall biosynthesis